MSRGLEVSSRKKDKLYKKTLALDCTEENIIIIFKMLRKIFQSRSDHDLRSGVIQCLVPGRE